MSETTINLRNIIKPLFNSLEFFLYRARFNYELSNKYKFYFISLDGDIYYGITDWCYEIFSKYLYEVSYIDKDNPSILIDTLSEKTIWTFYTEEENVIYAVQTKSDQKESCKQFFSGQGSRDVFFTNIVKKAKQTNNIETVVETFVSAENFHIYLSEKDYKLSPENMKEIVRKPYVITSNINDEFNGGYKIIAVNTKWNAIQIDFKLDGIGDN